MSETGPFQYVPLDKLKLYQNNVLFNQLLRRLNFSNKFVLTEVPSTDSVDIDVGVEIQGLGDLINVSIVAPLAKQVLRHDGTEWKNAFLNMDDLGDAIVTSPQIGQSLRYDGTNWVNAFPFFDDLIDAVISNPQAQQVIRHNGITWLNAFLSGSDLSDFEITSPTTGQVLRYDGTNFVNVAAAAINLLLNDLADVIITSATNGQFLGYNGSNWVNTLIALDALSDVVIGSLATGQTLQYNGTNWINVLLALNALTDVVITSPTNGQVLQYNGTNWVNATPTPGVVNLNDLGDVNISAAAPGHIIRYDGAEWDNIALAELLQLTQLSDVTISSPISGEVLTFSGGAWINQALPPSGGGGANALTDLTDVAITAAANGDILRHNGTSWVDVALNELLSLTNLSDVAIGTPATGEVIKWTGSTWADALLNLSELGQTSISAPTTGQILQYNGTNWANFTPTFSVFPDVESGGSSWGIWTGGARGGTGLFANSFIEGTVGSRQDANTGGKVITEFITGNVNDDQAGFSGQSSNAVGFYLRRDQNFRIKCKMQLPDITTIRWTIGVTAQTDLTPNVEYNTAFPTATPAFIFYWSSTVTTNIAVIRNDASGSAVVVDSGVSMPVNTPRTLEIRAEEASSRIGWSINGSAFTYYTTDIPAATVGLNYFFKCETKTNGTKNLGLYYAYLVQDAS